MPTYQVGHKHALALGLQLKPGFNFLTDYSYNENSQRYDVKRNLINFNMSSEVNLRYYFNHHFYIGVFMNSGSYNWQSTVSIPNDADSSYDLNANYKYNYFGFKLGV